MIKSKKNTCTKFRISLRSVRITLGYTRKDIADLLGLSVRQFATYERDASDMPVQVAYKLLGIYRAPFDLIHFGSETELRRKIN